MSMHTKLAKWFTDINILLYEYAQFPDLLRIVVWMGQNHPQKRKAAPKPREQIDTFFRPSRWH